MLFKSTTLSLFFAVLLHVPYSEAVGESSNLGTILHKKNKPLTASNLIDNASWSNPSSFLVDCKRNTYNQDKKKLL